MRKSEIILVTAYVVLCIAYFAFTYYTRTVYAALLKFFPDAAWVYRGLGDCDLCQSDYAAAAENFARAIDLDPRDYRAYFKRGIAFNASRNYGDAVADYTQA
ncbi:MAG: hypothetical protein WC547_05705, partial [Candidatus Omnitrophota bacterium]